MEDSKAEPHNGFEGGQAGSKGANDDTAIGLTRLAAGRTDVAHRARLHALRDFHTGPAVVRDLAGPVVRVPVGPRPVAPTFVVVTSPRGAHDVLAGSSNDTMDKLTPLHRETRLTGDNVFNLPYEPWKPQRRTLQPLFTKQHVATFAGHMATAADAQATGWEQGARVDLDKEMRGLTLRVLGRSLFGVDLDEHASDFGPSIRQVLNYITSRGIRPVRAPRWLPTPARRRFRGALADIRAVIEEAIAGGEADPDRACELVRLLLAVRDPDTGQPLTRDEVVSNLEVFLIAGHDTTSTTLTYALWALGHDPGVQNRVADEVGVLGERALTVDDVPALPFTVQVIHEGSGCAHQRLRSPGWRHATRWWTGSGSSGAPISSWGSTRSTATRPCGTPRRPSTRTDSAPSGRGVGTAGSSCRSAGARSCIGDHFAMLEATLGLASVVRRRRVMSFDPGFPLALPFTMTAGGPATSRPRVETR